LKFIKIVVLVLIIVTLVAWITRDYPFEWRELLPFGAHRAVGLHDWAALALLVIALIGARRIVRQGDRHDE
jgi:di/tricarboxylate transporter